MPDPDDTTVTREYQRGLALGRAGAYFEAHEAFEAAWRVCSDSERDFFQHAKSGKTASIFVGSPITNRTTGTPALVFSRRLEGRNGTFLGAVLVNVDLSYFRHVYDSITALTDQSFLFLRLDGVVLVRHPDPHLRTGDRMPADSPWYRMVANGGGYFRTPGVFNGTPRVVAVRPLADYPLVVDVAMSESAALAQWTRRATLTGSKGR